MATQTGGESSTAGSAGGTERAYATPPTHPTEWARGVPASHLAPLDQVSAEALTRLSQLPNAPRLSGTKPRAQAAVGAILVWSDEVYMGPGCLPLDTGSASPRLPRKQLQCIFTTRALHLRSHPGQASLPGGKVDPTDRSLAQAAIRESSEEIGLPLEWVGDKLFYLHTAKPCTSFSTSLYLVERAVGFAYI